MDSDQTPPSGSELPDGQRLWRLLQEEDAEDTAKPAPAARAATTEAPVHERPEPASTTDTARTDLHPVTVGFAKRPPSMDDGDYDSAVRSFYRDSGIAVMCRNHPHELAVEQCPECSAYYCQECMVVRRGRLICKDCAVTLFMPSEEDILSANDSGSAAAQTGITPEEHPEFQASGLWLGLEGRPSHPAKKLVALLLDLLVTRLLVVILAALAGVFFSQQPGPFFHLFDTSEGQPPLAHMYLAFVFFKPVVPWLVIFAIADFLYFFLSLSFFNRTLGMSWLSCRIVTEWGDFVGFGAVALRTLVFMVCLGWPAVLLSWLFPGFRGPHDYAAGTLVINYSGVKRIDTYETIQIKLA